MKARLFMLDVGTEEKPSFVPFVANVVGRIFVRREPITVFEGLVLLEAGPKRAANVALGTGPGRCRELEDDEQLELELPEFVPETTETAKRPARARKESSK